MGQMYIRMGKMRNAAYKDTKHISSYANNVHYKSLTEVYNKEICHSV